VYSISVIEHVIEGEVKSFLHKIWNLLKIGGIAILTMPVAAEPRIEYRNNNSYGLAVPQNDKGAYFFQRVYDDNLMRSEIIECWEEFGGICEARSVVGLKTGYHFDNYLIRQQKMNLQEERKAIVYAMKHLKTYFRYKGTP
jgi:predicted SAM-dependent methyltransferase